MWHHWKEVQSFGFWEMLSHIESQIPITAGLGWDLVIPLFSCWSSHSVATWAILDGTTVIMESSHLNPNASSEDECTTHMIVYILWFFSSPFEGIQCTWSWGQGNGPHNKNKLPEYFTEWNKQFPVLFFGHLSHMSSWAWWEQGERWLI